MLDLNIIEQTKQILANLEAEFTLRAEYSDNDAHATEFKQFVTDFAGVSDKINIQWHESSDAKLLITILKNNQEIGIAFRGMPEGHEYSSLLLALLNADGKGKNLPDPAIIARIKNIKGTLKLKTYMSLSCTNCPDVVQALNIIALNNPAITHETIDGALFQNEINSLNIQGVPAVYAEGELLHSGRGDLAQLLQKIEDRFGVENNAETVEHRFDVIVLGGGPAGASAAIYSARKGLRVGIVAERIGGQVNDTSAIQNLISVTETNGTKLAANLREHLQAYNVQLFEHRIITATQLKGSQKRITARGGETFIAPAVIIATGASWRRLNLENEEKYIGRGVHFCPHCDGPFYKGKDVVVVGGGNSGLEAAIDLAAICRKVTVFEFTDTFRADEVLKNKALQTPNISLHTNTQTTGLIGDDQSLSLVTYRNTVTAEEDAIEVDGIFIQIGLSPNSKIFANELQLTQRGEIEIDASCRTSIPGVYAAGDVSTVPYKQIVVAMGEGAKAALSAFDDRMRGIIPSE
ncbi:MAG: alkyl hydroperoxide reductase subunit F [Prevotella micans]|nr:alkyl hydroperoxide reductase subunit F [Prevotella micans]